MKVRSLIAAVALSLAAGTTFGAYPTDEPLRRGMGDIRTALDATLVVIHDGTIQPAHFRALGETIAERVETMANHSKLAPGADERMYGVFEQLLEASDKLRNEPGRDSMRYTARVLRVLGDYAQAFDHPGWRASTAPALLGVEDAKRIVRAKVPGRVVGVELHQDPMSSPHYHVDVALKSGRIGLLGVDALSSEMYWREPRPE